MDHRKINLAAYDARAAEFAAQYDRVRTPDVLMGLDERLPRLPSLRALVPACGSGRDAVWLAEQGYIVDASDGAEGMVREAQARNAHPNITYYRELLPELSVTRGAGHHYDLIVLSAVWMHLQPHERTAALRNILEVARPGAVVLITLRHGPSPDDRLMFDVSAEELRQMAAYHLVPCEALAADADKLGRDVWWENVYLRTPTQNLDALKLIKAQVVQGRLYSPYNPGFIFSLGQAVIGRPEAMHKPEAGVIALPFADLAAFWARIYAPAVAMKVPQHMAGTAPVTAALPHLASPARQPEAAILSILRDGPLKHITDPHSGLPVFCLVRAKDGAAWVRFPEAVANVLQAYHSLVAAGAAESMRRFLMRHSLCPPATVEGFVKQACRAGL